MNTRNDKEIRFLEKNPEKYKRDYFKSCFSKEKLKELFPEKEIEHIKVTYISDIERTRGDVISNLDGATVVIIEFKDGTSESIRWKDTMNNDLDLESNTNLFANKK